MKREKRLDQLLEDSLLELDRVGDVNAVLRRYPEEAENLRPLLKMAQAAHRYYDEVPEPPGGLKAGRERFLQEAARQREQGRVATMVTRRKKVRVKERRPMFRFAFVTKLVSAVLAVIIGVTAVGGGVSMASADSLPGDMLYPAKVSLEDARMGLALTSDSRFNLALRFADERLAEIEQMTQRSQSVPDETVARMHQLLNRAMTEAAQAPAEEMPGMLEQVTQHTAAQVQAMEQLQSKMPGGNQAQIASALQACQQVREEAMSGLEDPRTFRTRYQQREGMPEDVTPPTPRSQEPGGHDPDSDATPEKQQGGSGNEDGGGGQQGNGAGGRSGEDSVTPTPAQQRNQNQGGDQTPEGGQQQGGDQEPGPSDGGQGNDQGQDQNQNPTGEPDQKRDQEQDPDQNPTGEPHREQGQDQSPTSDDEQGGGRNGEGQSDGKESAGGNGR